MLSTQANSTLFLTSPRKRLAEEAQFKAEEEEESCMKEEERLAEAKEESIISLAMTNDSEMPFLHPHPSLNLLSCRKFEFDLASMPEESASISEESTPSCVSMEESEGTCTHAIFIDFLSV
jgi:hypothetical protein